MTWPVLFFLVHTLDAGTTHLGLSRGFQEAVIPSQSAPRIWVVEETAAAVETALYREHHQAHPKLIRALSVLVVAGESSAVAWNAHQLLTHRR